MYICISMYMCVYAYRFRSLLSAGAVVLKQESTLFEFWEGELVAYQHYVPVKADLSDLVAQVQWRRASYVHVCV